MAKLRLTVDRAWAIATDVAQAQMRKAGRICWNAQDYRLALRTFDTLTARVDLTADIRPTRPLPRPWRKNRL